MTLYYFEVANFFGKWTPRVSITKPKVKRGRLLHSETTGPRVREITKVPAHLEGTSLDELFDALSPDGGKR